MKNTIKDIFILHLKLFQALFAGLMVLNFIPQCVSAQEASPTPPSEEDTISVDTDLVQIETIVKDRKGKIVRNLTADDFEIVEDGKVRPIEFFSFVPITESRKNIENNENSAKTINPDRVKRTLVFIVSNPDIKLTRYIITSLSLDIPAVETFSYRSFSMAGLEQSAIFLNKFINETLTEYDLVSINDTEANLGTLSNFTNDKEVLLAAVQQMKSSLTQGKYPVQNTHVYFRDRDIEWRAGDLIEQNLNTIDIAENAVEQLQKMPGQKLVFLLARGMLGATDMPGVDVIQQRLKSVIEKANQSKVTFYSLSLKTLGENGQPPGQVQSSDNLRRLAEKTGGRAVVNTNDISVGFNEILEENNGYYQLAFTPDEASKSKAYQVKINLKRRDLVAQYRSSVYQNNAINDETNVKELVLKLLRTPFSSDKVKVKLAANYKPENKKQGKITTVVNIDPQLFQPKMLEKGIREIKLDLGIQVTEPDNKISRQEIKNFSLKLSEESWRRTLKEGLVYQFDTTVEKTGTYLIKIAACINDSNQCGNANGFINTK